MIFFVLLLLGSCKNSSPAEKTFDAIVETISQEDLRPAWTHNAAIYQVNIQQFTKEGTFNAFKPHIPRLKDLGVQIVLLMPIFAKANKKQSETIDLYKDIMDFKSIDESLGSFADFQSMVKEIHRAGMFIVLECPIQHTAAEHNWKKVYPAFYKKGKDQNLALDYSNKKLRTRIFDDLNYWTNEVNMDGICIDKSNEFAVDFLEELKEKICIKKDKFLIFDSNINNQIIADNFAEFDDSMFTTLQSIANKKQDANQLEKVLKSKDNNKLYFNFTSNDFYNRKGTEFNRFGDAHKAMAVLCVTLPGMPLIYSGQEEPSRKALSINSSDKINFKDYIYTDFYRSLLSLKKRNKSLWNGNFGGKLHRINTSKDASVFAFTREMDGDKVVVIVNLSNKPLAISLNGTGFEGDYQNVFGNSTLSLNSGSNLNLRDWEYLVLSNR